MKYFFVVAAFLFLPFFAFAESIPSFDADITLNNDGSFDVVETITYDFEEEYRHGIFRFIEKKHPQEATQLFKDRTIAITRIAVTQDGQPVPFEITETSAEVEVRIGDPNKTITGLHTYVISYTVTGGYSYFEDGSIELYWNVTGNKWQTAIREARATLMGHQNMFASSSACYRGSEGSNEVCEDIEESYANGHISFKASMLSSGEGMTIAQELVKESVEVVIVEKTQWTFIGLLLLPLITLGGVIAGYRYKTQYKTGRTIIPQYEPYQKFKPMYTGALFDGRLDPHDITAGIVNLAQLGHVKIHNVEKKVLFVFEVDDYEIELVKELGSIESPHLRTVIGLLFDTGSPVGTVVSLSSLRTDTVKQRTNALTLAKLRSDIKKDMAKEGFYEIKKTFFSFLVISMVLFGVVIFFAEMLPSSINVLLIALSLLCGLVFTFLYERRTRRGYEALDHLKGFKLFLSVTDAERFTFHNAPQKSPEQFMEYLPYAIAFGVEKEWAEVFKDITIPNPGWYDSTNSSSFSAVSFATSIGAFSSSLSSSGTSASSSGGSGGGGSSGGGGGGGGGGSW